MLWSSVYDQLFPRDHLNIAVDKLSPALHLSPDQTKLMELQDKPEKCVQSGWGSRECKQIYETERELAVNQKKGFEFFSNLTIKTHNSRRFITLVPGPFSLSLRENEVGAVRVFKLWSSAKLVGQAALGTRMSLRESDSYRSDQRESWLVGGQLSPTASSGKYYLVAEGMFYLIFSGRLIISQSEVGGRKYTNSFPVIKVFISLESPPFFTPVN